MKKFLNSRIRHILSIGVCTLLLAFSVSCKSRDDAPEESSQAAEESDKNDVQDKEQANEKEKKARPRDEERDQERAEAQKARKRFLDPELVQSIRAQSGLISLPPPEVTRLLHRADLRDVMLYTGPISTEPLAGRAPDSLYNAVRFAMGSELGCSLQRWVFPFAHDLVLHFDEYVDTMYEPEKEPRIDAATYFSTIAGVRMVVMRHGASRSMIQLSCTESLLSQRQLRTLSERVISRL